MPPSLVLQFLGLPQLQLDNKPIVTDRRKAVAILAYLSVNDIRHARQRYSRESLSTLFWPDYDQARAFSNLRRTIWEVRQTLGESWLIADRDTVHLNEEMPIDLDVARFRDLLSQSHQQSDLSHRIGLGGDAVKLYRDHFLTGFSLKDAPNFNEWVFAESEELRRQLAEALATLSKDHCALGQAELAIPYARRLVSLDQLDESAHRQLMEVYLQAGQHSAALKQYQICEQILRKELGVDPQPETYALYKQIRRGEVKPAPALKPSEPARPRHNLPLHLSTFIGRKKEQAEVANLLARHRLVTLTGAGGLGKTRLSIQVALSMLNDFPDGTWLVELASLSDPELVPQTVVSTLGLLEQAGHSPLSILTDFLQAKRALLILDNCEHLLEACPLLAEALLHACPDLHILATSREALGVTGEVLYVVPPLTTPDPLHRTMESISQSEAVQLFLKRAQVALPEFAITPGSAPVLAQICYQLDGIPLAIELAAARLKVVELEQIAARLDDRFRLLTGGARTALPRHQTLQALIDWSHDLLTENERVLLRRLSVFADGWTLEAAEAVCAGEAIETGEILDSLTELLNKSLVMVEHGPGSEARYRMLETIRQYAHDKLVTAGEEERQRRRHLEYYVELAERAEPHLRALDMVMWLDRLEAERGNIRSALEWALENDIEAELRLASALLWFWHIRGRKNEGIEWLERALSIEAMDRDDRPMTPSRAMIRGKALNASASLMVMNYEFGRSPARLEESLALFKQLGPAGRQGMAYALLRLGSYPGPAGAGNQARGLLEQSLALFREVGDKFGAAECLMHLSGIAQKEEDHNQAILFGEEQLSLSREIGDRDGIAVGLANLGDLALSQGDYQKAITLYEEGLATFRSVKNMGAVSLTLVGYGDVFFWQGDYERAAQTYEIALAFAQELGYRFLIAFSLYSLGMIAWFQGDYALATEKISESQPVFRNVGQNWLAASSLHTLGDIALAEGDAEVAAHWYEDELSFSQEAELEVVHMFALQGLGKAAWASSDYGLAAKRFGECLRMSRQANIRPATFHSLYGLGRVAQSQGDYVTAQAFYTEALQTQRRRIGPLFNWAWLKTYWSAVSYPLEGFAVLAVGQNQTEPSTLRYEDLRRAARLFGAAESLYTPLRFEMSATERAEHDQSLATTRAALGEEAFSAAWKEGQAMTIEQAITYTLSTD